MILTFSRFAWTGSQSFLPLPVRHSSDDFSISPTAISTPKNTSLLHHYKLYLALAPKYHMFEISSCFAQILLMSLGKLFHQWALNHLGDRPHSLCTKTFPMSSCNYKVKITLVRNSNINISNKTGNRSLKINLPSPALLQVPESNCNCSQKWNKHQRMNTLQCDCPSTLF